MKDEFKDEPGLVQAELAASFDEAIELADKYRYSKKSGALCSNCDFIMTVSNTHDRTPEMIKEARKALQLMRKCDEYEKRVNPLNLPAWLATPVLK